MKKIVVVVVVLVALLLVAPWGVGKLAEKRLDHGLDKLVEAAPYLTVVERKYTHGLVQVRAGGDVRSLQHLDEGDESQGDRRRHERRGRRP